MNLWLFIFLNLLLIFTEIGFLGLIDANQETGTIRGKISLDTDAPPLPQIVVDKTVDFCGETLIDPVLIVHERGIKGAVVSLQWEQYPIQTKREPPLSVSLKSHKCLFHPRIQAAQVGSYLYLNSGDETAHNPHGWWNNEKTVFNITLLDPSLKFKRKLRWAGTYRVECDTHAWMKSYILVFNHPFFALTDEKGLFVLKNVPVGKHKVSVWHEILGEHVVEVIVKARKETQQNFELPFVDHRREALKPKTISPWPPGREVSVINNP